MNEETRRVAEHYIDAVRRNDAAALPLHPDMVGVFPMSTYSGAEAYRQGLEPFARIVKSIDLQHLVVDGEHCVALLHVDTIFGVIPLAEHIQVRDGQIIAIRGYYDPRPMLENSTAS